MNILQIYMQSDSKVLEILPEEAENAELVVEDVVCQILLELFGGGSVDEVSIHFSSYLLSRRKCSIQVHAQCSCQSFALIPCTSENMELAVEKSIRPIMTELFGPLKVDCVILNPSPWKRENGPAVHRIV